MAALSGNVGTDKGGLTNGSLSNQQLNILRDKLDVLTLLPELVKKGLISSADSDIIRRYRHVSVQREKVLDSVQQGGSFAVNVFLDVLSAEDHQLFQLITAEQNSSKTGNRINFASTICVHVTVIYVDAGFLLYVPFFSFYSAYG